MLHRRLLILATILIALTPPLVAAPNVSMLQLRTRSREVGDVPAAQSQLVEKTVVWDPRKTALVIIDMWDDHWCKRAAGRTEELAGPMNKFTAEARRRGVLVVHCPSSCTDFYKETAARRTAIDAPAAKPPRFFSESGNWAWNPLDKSREPELPIDDSDSGCDCPERCQTSSPWKRQIATIDIDDRLDAITDNGQELYNLFAERGIENVMICGVHLNMCVLGRPFGIRQMVKLGKNVVLVRDMTDTMYNPGMRPFVDHFAGTELVVEHVEKYWCPTIESTDLVGGEPFRFADDAK